MIAYISAPYRGRDEAEVIANTQLAEEYGEYVTKLTFGEAVVVHSLILAKYGSKSFPPGSVEDLEIIEMNVGLLRKCDRMYLCGDRISFGMQQEIEFCEEFGIPVMLLTGNWLASLRMANEALITPVR